MPILSAHLPDGSQEPVEIRLRKQRRMILHVDAEEAYFWMSAPRTISMAKMQEFLDGKGAAWIMEQRERLRQIGERDTIPYRGYDCPLIYMEGPPSFSFDDGTFMITAPTYAEAESLFWDWWYGQIDDCIGRVLEWAKRMGTTVILRDLRLGPLKSAWGICYPEKCVITFSDRLYALPERLIDYIILHEVTHLVYPDHGPQFRAKMFELMLDWEERRRELKAESDHTAVIWPRQPG
ncbi:MAG: M48 family metallopeptidase [Clostridia bacterium]|nr:M48 family metallopeptidase [Clostridia bacterium]